MATRTAPRSRTRQSLSTGPWKGVRNTKDPLDDVTNDLVDAVNRYIPDIVGGSGIYARRGFDILNKNTPLEGRGQAVYCHVALDGAVYNIIVAGGKILLYDRSLTVYTDVTPLTGVTIDPDVTRVYLLSFNDHLIISDGVNPPWIAGSLAAPVWTGTPIDFDGLGTVWSAYGRPTEYAGSVFFIINEVAGVKARTTMTWCGPGDPTVGYAQPDYDYVWTLIQTGSGALYALWGTNVGLYYFRDKSIGMIAGIPGPDLQQTHTADAIAANVGCLQSATIAQWGNTIYFCDAQGRPYAMPLGGTPQPIWLNLRSVVDDATSAYPSATAQVACAVIDPATNLYIAPIWSPVPGVPDPPLEAQVIDAKTGAYDGRWTIADGSEWQAIGILNDVAGLGSLVVVGTEPPLGGIGVGLATEDDAGITTESGVLLGTLDYTVGRTGVIWAQNAVSGDGDLLTTQDGDVLTTQDGYSLITQNTLISWKDDGRVFDRSVTTNRMGFSDDFVWNFDQLTLITQNDAPCTVTLTTTTTRNTLEGTPSPSASDDDTYRLVCGLSAQGRDATVTVNPTTAEDQHIVQRISVQAIPSRASWQEP